MDDDSKEKLKDILSAIDPVEFQWQDNNMNSTSFTAQEVDTLTTINKVDIGASYDTITLGPISPIDLGNITITGAVGSGSSYISSNGIGTNSWTSAPSISIGGENGKNYIKTKSNEIDIDELADVMETVKKRLLILTPSFEMHEKYPMLKEMYEEYKAMERLLGGPDSSEEQ